MKNGFFKYFPVWLIVIAVLNVLAWVPPFERDSLFYTVYGIVMATFVIQLFIVLLAFSNRNRSVSNPLFIYSIVGLVMLFAVNYYFIGDYYGYWRWFSYSRPLQPWMFIVINAIFLGLHYIFLIAMSISLNKNVERDEHVAESTALMNGMINEVKKLYSNTGNKDIYRLYEALKYSDKRTKDPGIEQKIKNGISSIREIGDDDLIKDKVNELIKLINERN